MIKKVFSISLVVLMIAAMLHLSVATHYCDGKEAATKVSFTGKLANCGMESSEKGLTLPGISFTKHCCDDIVTFCGIDNNYTPSFSFVPKSFTYSFQVIAIPIAISVNSCTDLIPLYTNVSRPGALMSTNVDLSDICVFRI